MTAGRPQVAVVGGGWAGCSAAVELARRGVQVTLYEQASVLGGRARTVEADGLVLDNGQHLLVGAYRAVLGLVERLHGAARMPALLQRMPLTVEPFGARAGPVPAFRAAAWPAPWHLARAVLRARGLSLGERFALAREYRALSAGGFERGASETVRECFDRTPPRVYAGLWAPLCLAALNTPPERASARIFGNVLRAALGGSAAESEFVLPRVALGTLLPDPAAAFVAAQGGTVRSATRVGRIREAEDAVWVEAGGIAQRFDAVVLAAGPHQLRAIEVDEASGAWTRLQARVGGFAYESINTIYLAYPVAAMDLPLARLDDDPGQWLFDRGPITLGGDALRLLALVISANGAHDALPQPKLVAKADAQLRRLEPALPPLRFGRVIAERRATYACVAALDRPQAGALTARLHLAGDYTHPEFPATLEAAVASGATAAQAAMANLPSWASGCGS